MKCFECGGEFDPTKDFYVTINERKGPSLDFCSLVCTATYIEDSNSHDAREGDANSPFKDTWPAWQKEVDTSFLDTDLVRFGWAKPTIYKEHEAIHVLCNLVDNLRRGIDVAWLAGLYEGEGTLVFKTDARNKSTAWNLSISSTDEDVIRRAHEIAGVGNVTFIKRQKPHWQDQWRWMVSNRADIATVLTKIQPHLGDRRAARVAEFFQWFATRQTSRLTRDG